ncbi:hypothetical protein CYLTODRAFT_494418 [Cylindrobasidium torrendii FP15055 ss-10]|uniref:Large ribosomal subunit protein bL28c n=1 Tax=Cylindrobasidium torrendii FP15055 ss-10 TaxID=1314674 RepID=A0A0D7AWN5_9AGAR|nr:hypothetical protein CYLTODRAFT_494418 [Cylindrobasidium torrendii FP15055 ss-10]
MRPTLGLFAKALAEPASQPFKRAQYGLFGGKMKQYGNNVPFSKKKTRRTWLPNVQTKRFFSYALNEYLKVKVTTRALKTINNHGGIDEYLTKSMPKDLSYEGMRLRVLVQDALKRPVIDRTLSAEEQKIATAVRQQERLLRSGPSLEDAHKIRLELSEKLKASLPAETTGAQGWDHQLQKVQHIVAYLKKQAAERRELVRKFWETEQAEQKVAPAVILEAGLKETGPASTSA